LRSAATLAARRVVAIVLPTISASLHKLRLNCNQCRSKRQRSATSGNLETVRSHARSPHSRLKVGVNEIVTTRRNSPR
jgi:hypothetical protein